MSLSSPAWRPLAYGPPGAFSTPMTMPMSSAQTVSLDPTPPAIRAALAMMAQIRHLPQDEPYMRALGVDIIFQDGAQALQTLMARGCRIAYGDMGDSKAHAEWRAEENKVIINQKYQGDESPHMLRAISEALYHETGHVARQGDGQASLQEEINCLALNTLAHRYHMATVPGYAQSCSQSRLITDGVALYEKLFFDADPSKRALVARIIEKYGDLPPETIDHRIPFLPAGVPLADRVLRTIQYRRASAFMPNNFPAAPPFMNPQPGSSPAPSYSQLA
ncbi:MAG: hypothetical protein IPK79_06430 [Vampirovibrionales bacterium]|nr:hypothetical protein [Vampirovibrionales bacterium]